MFFKEDRTSDEVLNDSIDNPTASSFLTKVDKIFFINDPGLSTDDEDSDASIFSIFNNDDDTSAFPIFNYDEYDDDDNDDTSAFPIFVSDDSD